MNNKRGNKSLSLSKLTFLLPIFFLLTTISFITYQKPSQAVDGSFNWNASDKVLTIQGDCKAQEIKTELRGEATQAEEVCFSGTIVITTDQGSDSPFSGAYNLERITATENARVSFTAAQGDDNPTVRSFFLSCFSLQSIAGLSSWDVSNVTGAYCMSDMFYNCSALTSLNGLSDWIVSKVAGQSCMATMFAGCPALTSLEPLSGWDVSGVTGESCMYGMFADCSALTSLNGLSDWDVSKVTGQSCMNSMFLNCTNLEDVTAISSWNLAQAKASSSGVSDMFGSCPNITYIKGASTDAEGFVPTLDMRIPTLESSNNFYSETSPTTPVKGDVLLNNWSTYASEGIWTWSYVLTFNANGGQGGPAPESVAHNSYATQPTPDQNPTKTGSYFAGWYKEAACTNLFDFANTKLTSDTTLYAKWNTTPVYTVYFDTEGGSQINSQYIAGGATATRPSVDPTREGYTFSNWYTDQTYSTPFDFSSPISTNTTAYASWTANTYTASFNLNGASGTAPASITVTYGQAFPQSEKPTDPTWEGHSFEGWYTQARGGNKIEWGTTTVSQTANFTLYAHWQETPAPTPTPEPTPYPVPNPDFPDTWIPTTDGGWYREDDNGNPIKDKWEVIDDKTYKFDSEGYALQSEWYFENGAWYYFAPDCAMEEGSWRWIDGRWYAFNWDGSMCSGWFWDNDYRAWYYAFSDGAVAYGNWVWIDGAWYGFNWDCTMSTGWIWDNSYAGWYYCYSSGDMAHNTWIDGCYVNNTGRWIR